MGARLSWAEAGSPSASASAIRAALRRLVPRRSLPPCGGGTGRGVATNTTFAATPLPNPPPVEVGFTRLRPLDTGANPGKPGFAWGREPTEFAATSVLLATIEY